MSYRAFAYVFTKNKDGVFQSKQKDPNLLVSLEIVFVFLISSHTVFRKASYRKISKWISYIHERVYNGSELAGDQS